MKFQSYKDLEIYKKSHKLVIEIHAMSLKLPPFELYEEGSQIRKSSKSIKSNIVEGFGRRRYKQEFIKFLVYSLSSCDETAEHINTLFATGSLKDEELYRCLSEECDHLGRMINNFVKSVESSHLTKATSIEHPGSRIKDE